MFGVETGTGLASPERSIGLRRIDNGQTRCVYLSIYDGEVASHGGCGEDISYSAVGICSYNWIQDFQLISV